MVADRGFPLGSSSVLLLGHISIEQLSLRDRAGINLLRSRGQSL